MVTFFAVCSAQFECSFGFFVVVCWLLPNQRFGFGFDIFTRDSEMAANLRCMYISINFLDWVSICEMGCSVHGFPKIYVRTHTYHNTQITPDHSI